MHFQLVMLAYNLNCWLLLFQREEGVAVDNLEHTRLATARLRFLFVAAKIWKHSGRVGISYSDQYAERGLFQRLMKRLREITNGPAGFLPVLANSAFRLTQCIEFYARRTQTITDTYNDNSQRSIEAQSKDPQSTSRIRSGRNEGGQSSADNPPQGRILCISQV